MLTMTLDEFVAVIREAMVVAQANIDFWTEEPGQPCS